MLCGVVQQTDTICVHPRTETQHPASVKLRFDTVHLLLLHPGRFPGRSGSFFSPMSLAMIKEITEPNAGRVARIWAASVMLRPAASVRKIGMHRNAPIYATSHPIRMNMESETTGSRNNRLPSRQK